MSKHATEQVLDVHHWNDTLFSFRTTRDPGLRFRNGEFIMIGVQPECAKPIMRAYSIASANHEDYLEFFSIKVPDGALTSKLQHLKTGDNVLVGSKPTGTLVLDDLNPGRNLYLFGTGTGLAPYLSIIQDPETYERFEKIVLVHGVRWANELAYQQWITEQLPKHEYFGDIVREQLIYYPAVTREPHPHRGRITHLINNGQLCDDIGLPQISPENDRAMICGSPAMLADLRGLLDERGFLISPRTGELGDYVIERAFVER